ncbi:MAG: glycosyltransferase family protein [Nitrospirae bacterium]|nr:glycosyltransferase family protein [Nitrospirota bacterium]
MLLRQIERLDRSSMINTLIVATSTDPSDDVLEQVCRENDINCFRGSLNDVLDRFYFAAQPYQPEHIVRLTADCPLADPQVIDRVIEFHLLGGYDYTSNAVEPTYPDGLDVEVFRFACMAQAWKEAILPSEREHVTPFIHQQPQRFKVGSVKNDVDLSMLRWTVDEPADFELAAMIYEALYRGNPAFTTDDILSLLESRPELKTWNTKHQRNEGYQKSLMEDALFLKKRRADG